MQGFSVDLTVKRFKEESMASIFKRPSGTWTVELYIERDRKTKIGLPTKSQREARRIADRIQALVDSRKTGIENQDSVSWLVKIRDDSPKLYKRLVELNLAQDVSENLVTIEMLESAFTAQRRVGDSATRQASLTFRNLKTFFGKDFYIHQITADHAENFLLWLRSSDAVRNRIAAGVFSENTIAKRLECIRGYFNYALRHGWISKNPFEGVKGKESPAFKKWHYVTHAEFQKMLAAAPSQRWRVILCLGRYAGCRGPSELHNLTWNMINLGPEPTITLRATKKEGSEDELRTIPICPILEAELKKYKEESGGEGNLFRIHRHYPISLPVRKIVAQSGIDEIPEPWYNERRSFCSDIMESGIDPKLYEAVCGHRFEVGMRHYQILHPERQRSGFDKIRKLFPEISSGDNSGDKTP